MASGKLSPRQKMIGMMYLVLTALLALNVSKEILNAFITVNEGLEETNLNFEAKNQEQYSAFIASYNENQEKVGPYWSKAQEVQKLSNEAVDYINEIKVQIIAGVEGKDPASLIGKNQFGEDTVYSLRHVQVKDNYIYSTNLLVGSEPGSPTTGKYSAISLKNMLINYRDELKKLVPDGSALETSLDETFSFEDRENASGKVENWAAYNFYGVPMAAAITILTKMETNIRNAESDVLKYLYSSVDASSFKFNKLEASVIPSSNYVLLGDTFRAEVFLAAFDTTKSPEILLGESMDSTNYTIGGEQIDVDVEHGKGYINIPTNAEGDFTYHGVINYKTPSGTINHYPFKTTYQVAQPSTTIAPTKMNVFYIGVPNPVSISAPGVAADKVQASISQGSITRSKDGWVVNVSRPGTAKVSVSANMDGETKNMGSMEFRVKQIPDPIAEIGGRQSGAIRKAQLLATSGIVAKMENFDFEVRVLVNSYTFMYQAANGLLSEVPVNSNRFDAIKGQLQNIPPNSMVFFDDIKVKMPDGTTRTLPTLSLKVI